MSNVQQLSNDTLRTESPDRLDERSFVSLHELSPATHNPLFRAGVRWIMPTNAGR